MAAYIPLIGSNLVVSFVDAGAAAVTNSQNYVGRPGSRRFAALITVNPGSVANDLTLTLTLQNTQLFGTSAEAVAYVTEPSLSWPIVSITPASQAGAAQTPAASRASASVVAAGSLFAVREIFSISFTDDTVAGNNVSTLNIDWGYTASN